jgi:putative lipoprotein
MNAAFRATMLVAALTAGACAGLGSEETTATVTGRAIYPESAAILPESALWVQLLDVSRQDGRADLIAETMIPLEGRRPPVEFRLAYRREAIDPSHQYSVRATINFGDRLLFTTTRAYPVLTRGAPHDLSVHLDPARPKAETPGGP